jgi:Cof subfamily protein (haloacid dehalogenase superfamily)
MYKAVFIDMDGTLLSSDHTISEANKSAIQKLIDKGIIVVPISARPLHGMQHIINTVFPETMPVVSLNGSYIYFNKKVIRDIDIALYHTVAIQRELENFDVATMYYSKMDWFATATNDRIAKEQKITPVLIKIQPFIQILSGWEQQDTGPNKILIAGDKDLILTIEEKLVAAHKDELNIYKSQPSYLEVMNTEASKTKAIQFLQGKFGILQHEIVAIGDNYNDIGMIEYAGMGIAMGNAPDDIKSKADHITDTNNNAGVAKALDYIFG